MGSILSKSTIEKNNFGIFRTKKYNCWSSLSFSKSILSACIHKNDQNDLDQFDSQQRRCSKKKVLILGLDGVGKTDLFTRLINHQKKRLKVDSLSRPTIGKFSLSSKQCFAFY